MGGRGPEDQEVGTEQNIQKKIKVNHVFSVHCSLCSN